MGVLPDPSEALAGFLLAALQGKEDASAISCDRRGRGCVQEENQMDPCDPGALLSPEQRGLVSSRP